MSAYEAVKLTCRLTKSKNNFIISCLMISRKSFSKLYTHIGRSTKVALIAHSTRQYKLAPVVFVARKCLLRIRVCCKKNLLKTFQGQFWRDLVFFDASAVKKKASANSVHTVSSEEEHVQTVSVNK